MISAQRVRSLPIRSLRRRIAVVGTTSHHVTSHWRGNLATAQWCPNFLGPQRSFHSSRVDFKDYPEHTVVAMPALSPTMEVGTISNWQLKEGDSFGPGSVMCSVETDKATMDFEAQDDGVLAKILRDGPEGVDVAVGVPIAVVVEDEADVAPFADFTVEPAAAAPAAPADAPAAAPAPAASTPVAPTVDLSESHLLMPSARFLAESKGVDATGLAGSGKGGRVTKGDVLSALESGVALPQIAKAEPAAPAPAPPVAKAPVVDMAPPAVETSGTYEDVTNSGIRKVIARRLTESKQEVPHFYASVEVELDNALALRKQLAANHDVKVSVNDLVIRASSLALRDVPEVNASYDPKSDTVALQDSVDISVAVATPTGLITPIVPKTDTMGLSDITNKVRDLAGRARDGKLAPEEYQGGTFCISNLGMFGIDEFAAVINPPQAAILAVGGGIKRVVSTPYVDGAEEQPKPSVKTIMTARLSADRRVVDEANAALFLSAFKHYLNKPELMLL